MKPELIAAIRSGALPAVERIVFDMVHEAYLNGRKGIEEELVRMTENRDTWRSLAFEAKAKIVAIQAWVEMLEPSLREKCITERRDSTTNILEALKVNDPELVAVLTDLQESGRTYIVWDEALAMAGALDEAQARIESVLDVHNAREVDIRGGTFVICDECSNLEDAYYRIAPCETRKALIR